jgi:hypothetical protein
MDASGRGNAEFLLVFAELRDGCTVKVENLGDEDPEFAITQDGNRCAFGDPYLVQDFAGRGDGFGKDGMMGWHGGGDTVEIDVGQCEEFGESARMADDAKNRAIRTVTSEIPGTPFAAPAGEVDFTNDALSDEGTIVRFDDLTHEFMARTTAEAIIAVLQLEVGVADAGGQEADERESFGPARFVRSTDLDASVF